MSVEHEARQHATHRKKARTVNALIMINAILFVMTILLNTQYGIDLYKSLGLHHPKSELFRWHQFVSHIFMHGGYLHLFINMFVLWMFGSVLEVIWGYKRFLIFYFFTGFGAAALHLATTTYSLNTLEQDAAMYIESPSRQGFIDFTGEYFYGMPPQITRPGEDLVRNWQQTPNPEQKSIDMVEWYVQQNINKPTVGASGAIYGLLMAFGILFPNVYIYLYFLFPIKAKYFVLLIGAMELYSGVFGQNVNIANFAHLGGMLFGFILLKVWGKRAHPEPGRGAVY